MSLIGADETFALGAALTAIVAISIGSENTRWGRPVGAPLLILLFSMLFANAGVIPHSAGIYDSLAGLLVPLAIPMLLFRADFRKVVKEAGPMLLTFLIAASVTVAGAFAGSWIIDLGEFESEIVAALTASYIGGSLNFVATAEAVGIRESATYLVALTADAVGAVVFLTALMMLPAFAVVRRAMPSKFINADGKSATIDTNASAQTSAPFNLGYVVNGIALSLIVCALAHIVATTLNAENLFILIITALGLLVANLAKPLVARVSSEFEIGTLFMYIFFAIIGAGADITEIVGPAFPMLMFILVMVAVHIGLMLVIGKLLKLDLAEVMIASNACILGPAPAAALAASKGWRPLVTPGMLVGLFGYAIATFVGVGIAAALG